MALQARYLQECPESCRIVNQVTSLEILRGEFAQDSTPLKKKRCKQKGDASGVQQVHAIAS
jgi:hypothetical protein